LKIQQFETINYAKNFILQEIQFLIAMGVNADGKAVPVYTSSLKTLIISLRKLITSISNSTEQDVVYRLLLKVLVEEIQESSKGRDPEQITPVKRGKLPGIFESRATNALKKLSPRDALESHRRGRKNTVEKIILMGKKPPPTPPTKEETSVDSKPEIKPIEIRSAEIKPAPVETKVPESKLQEPKTQKQVVELKTLTKEVIETKPEVKKDVKVRKGDEEQLQQYRKYLNYIAEDCKNLLSCLNSSFVEFKTSVIYMKWIEALTRILIVIKTTVVYLRDYSSVSDEHLYKVNGAIF